MEPIAGGLIRQITEGDLPDFEKFISECSAFTASEKKEIFDSVRHYTISPEEDEYITLAYVVGAGIVGFVSFGRGLGDDTYEIYWLAVSPRHQGKGIGIQLMSFTEKFLLEKNARMIYVETESIRIYLPARKLYQKMGYTRSAKIKDYFKDGSHKIVYSKRIKPQVKAP